MFRKQSFPFWFVWYIVILVLTTKFFSRFLQPPLHGWNIVNTAINIIKSITFTTNVHWKEINSEIHVSGIVTAKFKKKKLQSSTKLILTHYTPSSQFKKPISDMQPRTVLQTETNIYNMLYIVSPQQRSKNTNNYRRRYKLVVQLSTPQRNAVERIICD